MRCLILYYSLTHSTQRIAENIAEGLKQADIDTDCVNIRTSAVPDIRDYQLIGIGTPVYAFRLPVIVSDCIKKLPELTGKRVFAFMLYGSAMFNAGSFLKKELNKKKARVEGWFFCYGAGYYVPYLRRGWQTSPEHPNEDDFQQARLFGTDMGKAQNADKWQIKTTKPPFTISMEQMASSPWAIKHLTQHKHQLDKSRCSHCRKCVDSCPVGNIKADQEGFPVVGDSCINCRHCLYVCPSGALDVPESNTEKKFLDYNVKTLVAENDTINKRRVRFTNGKIEI